MNKDIPKSFSKQGHVRDLSKNYIKMGEGPPLSDEIYQMIYKELKPTKSPPLPQELR